MKAFAALLRGINVGGKNIIKMTDLAACFESFGFEAVRTYIQSGNVIFISAEADKTRLTNKIESGLRECFPISDQTGGEYRAVLRSVDEFEGIVKSAPKVFGSDPATYRYDVIFLKEPLTSKEVMSSITIKEGVDQAFAGNGVLYFSRLIARASQSRLSRIISLPMYQNMTIRNWNTTTRLLEMLKAIQS